MRLFKALGVAVKSARSRRRPRPEELSVPGGRVRIAWSRRAVPTITAPNRLAAYHTLGRLHATDRLWQMDLLRRVGKGELSRLFGDREIDWRQTTIHHAGLRLPDLDYFLRVFGIARAARGSLDRLGDEARELLWAYVRGVNEGVALERRSLEHALIDIDPEPWTPLDAHVVSKVFAYNLCFAWKAKLAFRSLARVLGPGPVLDGLLPRGYAEDWPRIAEAVGALGSGHTELLSLDEATRLFTGGLGAHLGSNSWVVGGSRTTTGKPVLCGDPHLEATSPAPFYLARLRAGDLDVAGATVPGLPAVVIGRNRKVAWSCTNAMADDCDLFVVPLDEPLAAASSNGGSARPEEGAPRPLESLSATIEVRDAPPRTRVIRVCRGAPLLSPALGAEMAFGRDEVLAVRWTALESPGRELEAFVGLSCATDFPSFRRAASLLGAPAQNLSYADTAGHIGYVLAGRFPVRRGGPSLLPRRIDDPDGEWIGWVAPEELPAVLDPEEDVIAHANNAVARGYPHYLSCLWEPPHRIRRIVNRLKRLEKATPREVAAIQTDVISLQGLELVDRHLRPRAEALRVARPDGGRALDALLAWDGGCEPSSRGAAAFHVFYEELVRRVAEEPLGPAFACFREVWGEQLRLVEELLDGEEHPWLRGQSVEQVLADALAETVERLERVSWKGGWSAWAWGDLHQGRFRHALSSLPLLGAIFDVGPFPAPGSSYTVWNGHYDRADPFTLRTCPSLRFVADLSREDAGAARAVLPTGQSGDPLSPHYRDQLPLWLRGDTVRFGS